MAAGELRIVRLMRSEHNLLVYADFERRCRQFVSHYKSKEPIDAILNEMLIRWVNAPALCGYYLVSEASGHLAAWVQDYYGVPRIFVWQMEIDLSTKLHGAMIDQLRVWKTELNTTLPADRQVEIIEFYTWHDGKVWFRYLAQLELEIVDSKNLIEVKL